MGVLYRTGNLFQQTDLASISQGNNCLGNWGRGIAPQFKRYWPELYKEHHDLCKSGQFQLGDMQAWQAPSGLWIYCLGTQPTPGPTARMDAIEEALTRMLSHTLAHHIPTIGMPRIGCGLGGLNWNDTPHSPGVNSLVHKVAENHPTTVVVVTLPGQK